MSSKKESTITCEDTFEFAQLVHDLRSSFGMQFSATYNANSRKWELTFD